MALNLKRAVIQKLAAAYALRTGKHGEPDERDVFKSTWAVYQALVDGLDSDTTCAWQRRGETAVKKAPGWLEDVVRQAEAGVARPTGSADGFRHVTVLPTEGNYVVFSDHHITAAAHRQAFFSKHNVDLYARVLDRYRAVDFVVIENGDVEELIIFDPAIDVGEAEKRQALVAADGDVGEHMPAGFVEHRLELRLRQLEHILGDAALAPWWAASARLDTDRRLLRVAGNHDYDLQRPEFLAKLRSKLPNQEKVWDIVLLKNSDNHVSHAIMHGHQFDRVANPVTASRFGETISECLAIWYQGADRTWRWAEDGPQHWTGSSFNLNVLVEDDVSWDGKPCRDLVEVAGVLEPMGAGAVAPSPDVALHVTAPLDAGVSTSATIDPALAGRIESLFDEIVREAKADSPLEAMGPDDLPADKDKWLQKVFEWLFKHNVAWEYFEHDNALLAVLDEVFSGERFFKYRHMDEREIREGLITHFPDPARRPTLVLGHSHEPRLNSLGPQGTPFAHYLNSAAAGRFENLLWAIELRDGRETLVSWSAGAGGVLQRREWTNGVGPRLNASDVTPLGGTS